MRYSHAIRVAGVLAFVAALQLGVMSAHAQAPAPAPPQPPAPALSVPGQPRVMTTAVRRTIVSRIVIPSNATVGGPYRDWTTARPIPIAKPWLKAMVH
jgi:hypothetical protein